MITYAIFSFLFPYSLSFLRLFLTKLVNKSELVNKSVILFLTLAFTVFITNDLKRMRFLLQEPKFLHEHEYITMQSWRLSRTTHWIFLSLFEILTPNIFHLPVYWLHLSQIYLFLNINHNHFYWWVVVHVLHETTICLTTHSLQKFPLWEITNFVCHAQVCFEYFLILNIIYLLLDKFMHVDQVDITPNLSTGCLHRTYPRWCQPIFSMGRGETQACPLAEHYWQRLAAGEG